MIIKSKTYNRVDIQRGGMSAIYKTNSAYLRIGAKDKILKDLALHKKMESYGFPVAKLLDEGETKGMSFFLEESLGKKCFGIFFKEEMNNFGKIQNRTFGQFISICIKFAEAQLKTIIQKKKWTEFEKGIHLDILYEELPGEKEKIQKKWNKIKNNLSSFPFCISHGDFTPFNIYPSGVIDFEDSFLAPLGYDTAAIIEHLNWFPTSDAFEFYQVYHFTDEQKQGYCSALDQIYAEHKLPKISDFLEDFNFAKGVWSAVRMQNTPKLQQYRYSLLKKLIN